MPEKKSGGQSQENEGRRGFGAFLADVASGRDKTPPEANPPTPGENEQRLKRAAESVYLPKRVARLAAELAAAKRANNPVHKCPLWAYVREAKKKYPHRASDHAFIARWVDSLFEKNGKELHNVCPKKWKEVRELPRLMSDARKHPKLKTRIKVFISKVTVS
jgi:hypothetical protein